MLLFFKLITVLLQSFFQERQKTMIAVVEIAGQQFKVQAGQKVYVHRLEAEAGAELTFDKVLLTLDGSNVQVGKPNVSGAKVTAKVLDHLKGDKVIIFKKKRRKGYVRKNGHRQFLTQIEISNISA
jgi:large subunit ribosomal protein L21